MAANVVRVILEADDRLSTKLRIVGGVIDSVFDAGSRAVQGFTNSLKSAAQSQSDIVKSVGSLAATANQSYEESAKLTQDITEGLAQYAAALPGTTDQYVQLFRAISDDVASVNLEMNNGVLNTEQYTDQVTALAAKFQALGSDLPFAQVLNPLQKILAGGSISQLTRLKFFQSNPVLLTRLQEVLGQLGATDLKDLSKSDRLNVTLKALDLTLTDDTIARLNDTVDAQTQSFLTRLFDPTVGVFGLLRDLDRQTVGVQSAMTEITKLWTSIVGTDGVIFAFFDLLESMGVELGDPMQRLANLSRSLTSGIRRITQSFEVATTYFKNGSDALGVDVLKNLVARFTSIIPNLTASYLDTLPVIFNQVTRFLASLDWGAIGGSVGRAIADILNKIPGLLASIDYGAIYNLGFGIMSALSMSLFEVISNLDGQAIAFALGGFLIAQALPVVVAALTPALASIATGLAATLGLGLAGIPGIAVAAIALIVLSLVKTIQQHWKTFSTTFSTVIEVFVDGFTGVFKIVGGVLTGNIPMLKSGIQDIMDSFKGLFDLIKGTIDAFRANFGLETSGMISARQAQEAADQRFLDAARRAGTTSALGTPGNPLSAAGSRADGQVYSSLIKAAIAENRRSPSGSNLVVANTSETILNQKQTSALEGAIGGGIQIGSITINSSAHLSDQLADEIFGAIEQRWIQYKTKKATALG